MDHHHEGKQKPLKILIIGDSHVGKSSLLLRYVRNQFNHNSRATIGIDFLLKTLEIDGTEFLFQIWDTGIMDVAPTAPPPPKQ